MKRTLSDADEHFSKKKVKISSDSAVSLEEYYYAQNTAVKIETDEKAPIPYFRCNFCKRLFSNNIRMMSHIIGHVEESRLRNLDLNDLTRCKHCFRSFDTPFIMQSHIVAVHLHPNPLTCRICSLEFKSVESLVTHMECVHVQSEMPYSCKVCQFRSSFHKDVLQHFQKAHSSSDDVLCPYCLKVYGIRFSNQKYCYHLFRHQFKTAVRKCSSCCLAFLNGNELQSHRKKDHISMAASEGLLSFVAGKNRVLIMCPKTKAKSNALKMDVKPSTSIADTEPINKVLKLTTATMKEQCKTVLCRKDTFPSICADGFPKKCAECKKVIQKGHFRKFVRCGTCKYSTYCSTAFVEHMISSHSSVRARRIKINALRPVKPLKNAMFCCCGFSSYDGSTLATHLVQCGELVAYEKLTEFVDKCSTHSHPLVAPADKMSSNKAITDSVCVPDAFLEHNEDENSEDMLYIEPEVQILESAQQSPVNSKCKLSSPVESNDADYFIPYIASGSDEEHSSESFTDALTFSSMSNMHSVNPSIIRMEKINFEDPLQVESKLRILDEEAFSPSENKDPVSHLESHSAMFPPLVVLDSDEEASINESFSKIPTFPTFPAVDNSRLAQSGEASQRKDRDCEELPEEKPDMLQALGLIRKSALPISKSYSSSPVRFEDHTYTIQDWSKWCNEDSTAFTNFSIKEEECDTYENSPRNNSDFSASGDKQHTETESVRLKALQEDDSKTFRIHGEKNV